MILSPSAISQTLKCPHQRYLYLKLGPMPPGVAAAGGSAYHKAISQSLNLRKETGRGLPLDSMKDAANDHFRKQSKEGIYMTPEEKPAAQKILNTELNSTIATTAKWHTSFAHEFMPHEVEHEIIAEWNGIPLRGFIDLITLRDYTIIDWKKTSRKPNQNKDLIQSQAYSLLFKLEHGHLTRYEMISIVKDTVIYTIPRYHTDFSFLWGCIQSALKYFNSGIFPGCSPDAWWCAPKWCGYYQVCEARHPIDYFI